MLIVETVKPFPPPPLIHVELCCVNVREGRIQTERQERKRVKQELGIAEEPGGRKTRFDPPEPVAAGISLGIKPIPAGAVDQSNQVSIS